MYARLHYQELAAIMWAKDHLPAEARILTNPTTRHYEWFSALTNLSWKSGYKPAWEAKDVPDDTTYYVYFTKAEAVPAEVTAHNLPMAFQNEAAVIVGPL